MPNATDSSGLRGQRYIAYARCAAERGSAPKLRQQIRLIRQFGNHLGMRCVGEVRIAGVSGVTPPLRPDLRRLLTRKRQKDDFDVLIAADYARITRTAAARIEAIFALSGVRIVYLTEWHGDGTTVHHSTAQG
jgi:DNA invertase Pin-like site-specific DNA recombinase